MATGVLASIARGILQRPRIRCFGVAAGAYPIYVTPVMWLACC